MSFNQIAIDLVTMQLTFIIVIMHLIMSFLIDTEYAENFTYLKYFQVQDNFSEEQVEDLLGVPLRIKEFSEESHKIVSYTKQGQLNLNYFHITIRYKDGLVESKRLAFYRD